MYLLFCPCIHDPSLRATGITDERDLAAFRKATERCRRFGITVRYLPCTETQYLGKDHPPGHYLGRLDTPAFTALLDHEEAVMRDLFSVEGLPAAIIGVDSSPVCGVTQTYYGSVNGSDPKRPGRGVFLSRFPGIPAYDVCAFAAYEIYLAAPLFSEAEQRYNRFIAGVLEEQAYVVHLPQETGDNDASRTREVHAEIFSENLAALDRADFVVAIIDGPDADSGTAFEIGYAYAKGTPVIALRTDFRQVGSAELVNLMLEEASVVVRSVGELTDTLPCPVRILPSVSRN